jgi:pheromone shutdown protein TraB
MAVHQHQQVTATTLVVVVGMAHLQGIETAFERRAALAADSALE